MLQRWMTTAGTKAKMENGSALDKVDLKLLDLVRADGRITLTAMAKELGLSKSAVKYRMTELVSRGIIKSFFALVDSAAYGVTLSVLFDLAVEQRVIQDVAMKLASYDEVIRVYELANSPDLHVHALFRDNEHYETFIRNKLYSIPGIRIIKSGILMKRYKTELTLTI
jgi:Lrp/AsnC family leucine-responsive transcriptional regulator